MLPDTTSPLISYGARLQARSRRRPGDPVWERPGPGEDCRPAGQRRPAPREAGGIISEEPGRLVDRLLLVDDPKAHLVRPSRCRTHRRAGREVWPVASRVLHSCSAAASSACSSSCTDASRSSAAAAGSGPAAPPRRPARQWITSYEPVSGTGAGLLPRPGTIMCAERSSYGRAQGRSRAAFNMNGAIARLLFAVAFSEPGCDSFCIGVSAVVMAPLRGGPPGTGADGSIRHLGAGRVVCHGRAGRMSPGLVMAGTGGNPDSPRCWTYEPGLIPGRD